LDRRTGEIRTYLGNESPDPHEWYAEHDWVLDVEKIAELKRRVDREQTVVFLCGVAAGDSEAWEYFDAVCALVIDKATIRQRIEFRDDSWFGKRPNELDQILAWNVGYDDTYRGFGAVIVDATQPLAVVVDAVIATARHKPPVAELGDVRPDRGGLRVAAIVPMSQRAGSRRLTVVAAARSETMDSKKFAGPLAKRPWAAPR
jgi:hypothetical protein